MSWLSRHSKAEALANAGHEAFRKGDSVGAKALFRRSAAAETSAMQALGTGKPRTLGITAVSAVSLLYKAGEFERATEVANEALIRKDMPKFAVASLRELRAVIQKEMEA